MALLVVLLASPTLFALPEVREVVAGQAEFYSPDSHSVQITTSDKAIVNYEQFNIGEVESVQFIQPSARSSVLNRVTGKNPSKILGKLSGNGQVFLVNPTGIYFGPKATVNAGSFLASTLSIRDEDFLNDKFHFFQEPGAENSTLVNEGMISASDEGFVAMFSPFIENRGSILARASKVVIAAAEKVTLDFVGDGLIQFSLGGDLKQAVIENYGHIEASQGSVEISLRTAREAIKMVVNSDGITPANAMEECNGVIQLVNTSRIVADHVRIEGGMIDAGGEINVSRENGKGGSALLLGDQIQLIGAKIDASGATGGGTVLIGGDYQGKGELRAAQNAVVNSTSEIKADAILTGDGGKIILWSDDTTFFNGKIFARGGEFSGNGGFVETSGKENLGVETGFVNTSAAKGEFGSWLLDPNSITIAGAGGGTIANASAPNCGTNGNVNISVATMQAAATNVALCAQQSPGSTITVNTAFTMAAGVSLSMTAGSANAGTITLNAGITTRGQPLTLTGLTVIGANITLDTTNAGASPAGGNISFSNNINGSGARTLALTAGTSGVITMSGGIGGGTPLTTLSATGATITQSSTAKTTGAFSYTGTTAINIGGTVTTVGGIITMTGPVVATNATGFDTTNGGGTPAGANINFTSTLNGGVTISILAGNAGTATLSGAVGGISPPTSLSFPAENLIQIGSNITVTGANPLTFTSPVSLTGTSVITSNNANISFNSTLNGAQALTLTGGSGVTTFTGAVGGVTPLTSLSATAATVTQSSTAKTTGALSYTGSTAINIAGNVTTSGGIITMTGPVVVSSNPTFDSTNAGGTAAGANISFTSILNGGTAVSIRAGTGGVATFSGAVGGITPLTNLSFVSANTIRIGSNITVTGANPLTFPSPVSLTGTSVITSNNANISFNSTLNGAQALTLAGGSGVTTFTGAIGGVTPLTTLSATAATITQSSTAKTTSGVSYTGTTAININGSITTSGGPIAMTGSVTTTTPTFDTTNAGGSPLGNNITFSNTLNGAVALNLNSGTSGAASMLGAVGGVTPLTSLTVTGLTVTQGSSVKSVGAVSYTGSTAINVSGNITTTGATIGMTGPVTLASSPTFDSTNAGAAAAGANISFSSTINGSSGLTLRAGTGGVASFAGAIGGITPLTNLSFTSASLIQVGSDISVSGANPLNFPFAVSLTGSSNITSNNASISFSSTINDNVALTHTLRLIAGVGTVTLTGAVGGVNPLSLLAISSAGNVSANAITAAALSQSAGSGTTTFNGAISTSGLLGINLTGTAFTFNNTVTTTSGGGVAIGNSGLLTMPNGSTFTLAGAFSQTGSGSVQSGNVISSNSGILFTTAVALTHAASYSTSAAAQLINFMSTIDSLSTTPFDLTLAAGTSNISISGNVGSIHPLGAFLVSNCNNLTVQGVVANSATLNGGTGTTTINGNVLVGSGGINLTGNNFVNNGDVVTTNGGSITINNSGTATRTPGHTTVVDGNYSLIGTGPAFAGSSLMVKGNILINPAVTLVSNAIVDTSAGGGNITFSSTIDATHDLMLNAGSGTILISGNIGSGVPIGNLTIGSANNLTTQGIQATSITQTSGTGTTTFNGPLITSGALGISIGANNIIRGAAITTTGGGPLTITNSGTFTTTAAGAITLSGAFTQNGTGPVSFGGSITTANANISFSSPITLASISSLSTGTGIGDITLSQTVQGAFDFTLNSGTGNITLSGAIGTLVTPLTSLTITQAANVSTQAITAGSITQAGGTGTTTFNGALNTNGALGISLMGAAFTFNSPFTTTGGGPVSLTTTGLVTFSAGATGSIAGALTQTGSGSTQLSSSITAGGAMQFGGPFVVSGTGSLSTQAANQPITFFSTLDGPGNLTLSTGSADILISGNAGALTPLGNLMISTARNVTTQAVSGASITQSAGTGTTLFNGNLTTTGAGGIQLTGTAFTFIQNATASGAGSITINNSGLLTTSASKTLSGAGGFSQTGAGAVSLGSGISTTNTNISFVSPITLTSDVILNSGTATGDITVTTVNGNHDLTFTAGRDIFAGVIGGITRVGTVTFTTVRNNNTSAITASAIVQLAGSGTTFLAGNIDTNTPAGINLSGTNFTRSANIITTNGGSVVLTNTGLITGISTNTTSIDGSYTQIGVGPSATYNLAGTITARLGIFLSSPITLLSDPLNLTPIILDSSGGNGNISVTNTVNNDAFSPHTFILRSGSGNITLTSAVGNTAPIGPLKFGNAHDITAAALSADSIQQELGATSTGQASFNGAIATTGAAGIALTGNAFTFSSNAATAGGGTVAITNSGLFTISGGVAFNLDGSFTQSGAGSVACGGSITTTNDAISFASPITLTAPTSLNSGAGVGDITLSGTLNGASTLDLTAGTGNISLQSSIGQVTPISALTIHSGAAVLVNANATLSGPFTIVSASGPTTLNGTLTGAAVSMTGGAMNFNGAVTTTSGSIAITNGGTLTVASMSPIVSSTSFTQTGAGSIMLGSDISTAGTLSIASPVTLTNNVNLNSGGGNLTLSNTVGGAFDLTLAAGSGDITLSGAIGTPRLDVFKITSANDISVQSITAASITLLSSTGTATLVGNLDTNAVAGIMLSGNNFTTSGTINTTNGGPLTVTNSGLVIATGASNITLNGGGAFTQNGTGSVNVGGILTTQNGNISFTGPVSVLFPANFTSNGGDIVFSGTVDGPECLTLTAGIGDVTFNGIVGGITPLGCLTASGSTIFQNQSVQTTGAVQETGTVAIRLGGNIVTSATNITLTGNVVTTASVSLSTSGGAGDISVTGTLNGDLSGRNFTAQTGSGNVTLAGTTAGTTPFNNFTLSGQNISWGNFGSGIFGATGTTTLSATTNVNFTGTSYKSGVQIYTAGSNFNFTAGALTFIVSNVQPITFTTATIQLGATDLSMSSNGGHITLTPLLGTGRNLVVDADVGAMTFVQIGALGNNLNNVTLTSNSFSPTPILNTNVFAGTLSVNSSTPVTISTPQLIGTVTYNTPIIIQGNITYSCGAAGTITFNKTVDAFTAGVDALTFNFSPCGGSIIFNAPVGATAPLASLSINAPTNVTVNSTMNLGSFSVTNGTGTTAINSGITSTAAGGISIATSVINMSGSVTTANGGAIVLNNSGMLTISAGSSFNSSGALQQTGAGSVSLGGSFMTHDALIQFASPITLSGGAAFSSLDLTGANISFASTIQGGAQNLTLEAGSGDISLSGAVGTLVAPLNDIKINRAHNVTASGAIFADALIQFAGTGLSSFAALTTTGLNGISLTGSSFTFNGNITTTGGGPLLINNSGQLTFANAIFSIAGALTQSGAGSTTLAGAFTVGGATSFAGNVTLQDTTSLDTSANSTPITFSGTITNDLLGPHDLTLAAGSNDITCVGAIGTTPIGAFTTSSVGNATFSSISATSILQSAGSGITTIAGNLVTSGASGIHLTGTNFNITSTVTTTSLGPFSITNSGPLSLTLGGGTLIDGSFSQSGGGSVSLAGTVATNNQNLSFANAITLTNSTVLSTGAGAGTITLSSAVDGSQALSLTAGTGSIVFGANLGGITPLGNITVTSVNGITYPTVHAASIVQAGNSAATTITGPLTTTGPLGVSMTGGVINQNGAITTMGSGPVSFVNSGTLTVGVGVNTVAAGAYSQSGGGTVSLGGSVTSTNNPISFAGAVSLTADVVCNSGPASNVGNSVSFASAVTGAHALAITAVGGSITLGANVGTIGTPLTSFTLTNADTVSTQGVFAGAIIQLVGTGTTTFNGVLNASTVSGISLTGTNFTFDGTITSSGPLVLTNSGAAIFHAGATGTITGALTQNGTGSAQLASSITAGGAISFIGPFLASGTASLNTQAANQPITFFNTVDGPGNLTLTSGAQDITFNFNIGDFASLGALQITTVRNLTIEEIHATSISQSAGSGLSLFNGDIHTTGSSGVTVVGTNVTFLGNLTTTGSGIVTLTNSGTLTTTIGKMFSSNGVFTQNGSGSVLLGSTIATTNALAANAGINFSGTSPITLTAPASFDSSFGGGIITLSAASTVDGAQPVSFNAGTGDINILGDFGGITRIGALTLVSAHDIQIQAVTASSISQLAGSGTSSLLGVVDTDASAGITLIGNNFTTGVAAVSVTTTNGGSLIITNQGLLIGNAPVVITIDGSFIQNGPGIVFLGSVTARQGISFTGPGILAASATFDSSGGSGGIFFGNVVSAVAGTENLILTAGAGNITLSQPLGLTMSIGPYAVTSLGSITATGETISIDDIGSTPSAGVTGLTSLTAADGIIFRGTTYHAATQTYTVTTNFQFNAGALTTFSSDGSVMTFQGGGLELGTGTNLTMNTGGSNLTLGTIQAQAGDHRTLILNAGVGLLQVGDLGIQGNGEFGVASFTGTDLTLGHEFADAFTFNYTGNLHAEGDIVSTDTPLLFPNPVILEATNIFSTVGATGADITFSSTLNGTAPDTVGLTVGAGIGNVTFSGSVGVLQRLSNLTISSANNVTLAPLTSMRTDSLVQLAGSGTTTFNGSLIVPGVVGILLTGNNFTFNNTVQTLNNASLTVTNAGTLIFAGTGALSGAFTQNSTLGPVSLSGSITAGQPISFSGPVTLAGSPSLNTAAAGQTIQFLNTIGGSGNITLAAGSAGNITVQGAAGTISTPIGAIVVSSSHDITTASVFAQSVQLISSTGTATMNGTLSTSGAAGVNLVGNNFILNGTLLTTNGGSVVVTNSGLITSFASSARLIDGSYTQNGTGPVHFGGTLTTLTGSISFASPVTLLADSAFDSSAGNQNITFTNTVNGPGGLVASAGGGDISFAQVVGATTAFSNLTITSAHDVSVSGVGLSASGVLGTMSLQASHDINLPSTVYIAGSQIYSAGNRSNFSAGSHTDVHSSGGSILFINGTTHLSSGTDLHVMTNNGDFSFLSLVGTNLETVTADTGSGIANLGSVSSAGAITQLIIDAGQLTFSGPITASAMSFVSLTGISNSGAAVLIQSTNDMSFNALGGDVGTLSNPISIQSLGQVFAGAFQSLGQTFLGEELGVGAQAGSLANFNGTASGNTIHAILTNPPCIIIFNGVVIKNCNPSPPGPSPGPQPPAPPVVVVTFPFAVPGFDSSYFNLASDYFFLPYFFDERYVHRDAAMYYRASR